MPRTQSRLIMLFLAAIFGVAPAIWAQETPADSLTMMKNFDTALKLYTQGQYEQSAKLLDAVLKENPSSHEALLLREQAGMGVLVKMLNNPQLRDIATIILRRAAEESSRLQRDPAAIKQLVEQTGGEALLERETAIRKLVAIGPFAVPFLLDEALSDNPLPMTSRRVAALRIIREMGAAGVPPLLVAFENAGVEDATRIARMLGESPDARSVPYLAARIEDKSAPASLRERAQASLDAILIPAEEPDPKERKKAKEPVQPRPQVRAAQACLELATRYYYGDVALIEIVPSWQRVIWKWNAAGKLFAECLTAQEVPPAAYPRLCADALLLKGMKLPHDQPEFLELFLCNNYMQIADARAANDAARLADLEPLRAVNESLGASTLHRALARALRDGAFTLAQECISALRSVGDPRPPAGPNALVLALSASDKEVRAGASEALMALNPAGDAGAAGDVIATATAALGATIRPRILVLTQNGPLFNSLSAEIKSWNMVPERRTEQLDVVKRVRAMTPAVSLLILDTRLKGASAPGIIKFLRNELGAEMPPAILLAPPEDVKKLTADASGLDAGVLPIPPPLPDLMKMALAAVESADTQASEDILQDTEMVKRMLVTMAGLPRASKYPANELAGTMARLSTGHAQEIRILAMEVIASLPSAEPRNAMFAIFADGKEPVEVRRAAGAAFLNTLVISPALDAEQEEIIRNLTADTDKEVASQALHALAIADISQAEREARLFEIGPSTK